MQQAQSRLEDRVATGRSHNCEAMPDRRPVAASIEGIDGESVLADIQIDAKQSRGEGPSVRIERP